MRAARTKTILKLNTLQIREQLFFNTVQSKEIDRCQPFEFFWLWHAVKTLKTFSITLKV